MDLPIKRRSSAKRSTKSPKKRIDTGFNIKVSKPTLKPPYLKKELWIEILDYLDSGSYFCIISQVNSFFNSIVKNYKDYRTSLKICLKIEPDNKYYCKLPSKNGLECILNCRHLKKLELKLKNEWFYNQHLFRIHLEKSFISMSAVYQRIIEVTKFFKMNYLLKCIKLPSEFIFNEA